MIPNIFHFVFGLKPQAEPFHLMYYLCLVSCLEVNRPDAVVFHYHHEPYGEWWDRIRPRISLRHIEPEQFVQNYRYDDALVSSFRYAHAADFARLRILHDEGGIYADIDTLFLQPIPVHWFKRHFIMGHEKPPIRGENEGSLCNAWIALAPGSDFCRHWLEGMNEAFDGSWNNHSTLLPYRLSRQFPGLIDVEPESAFFAIDWTPRGIDDLFMKYRPLPRHAYSLHLWNHLWWSPERLDFSPFHSGRLTADYVAHADTTYACHARRFLPEDVPISRMRYLCQYIREVARFPLAHLRQWRRRERDIEDRLDQGSGNHPRF